MRLWTRLTSFSQAAGLRYPPLGRLVQLPHGAVHVFADGAGTGPPLVLLHGASGNLRDFTLSILPLLAQHQRVIAIDRPGFGHSDPVPEGWRLRIQVAVLRSVLHRLGYERYHIIGHSYSGALALAWAIVHSR